MKIYREHWRMFAKWVISIVDEFVTEIFVCCWKLCEIYQKRKKCKILTLWARKQYWTKKQSYCESQKQLISMIPNITKL